MSESLLREYVRLVLEKIRNKNKGMDGKFNFRVFKRQPDREKAYYYAYTHGLQELGCGSSRCAFVLTGRYALKIARNAKGIAQNLAEMDVASNPASKPVVSKILDYAPNGSWLVSELVKPIKSEEEFYQLTTVPWPQFEGWVMNVLQYKEPIPTYVQDFSPQVQSWFKSVIQTAKANNLMPADLVVIDHWGKTPDGRVVILDYGFTKEVWIDHYDGSDDDAKTGMGDGDADEPYEPTVQITANYVLKNHSKAAHALAKQVTDFLGDDVKNIFGSENPPVQELLNVFTIMKKGPELYAKSDYIEDELVWDEIDRKWLRV